MPRLPHPRTALSGYADSRLPAWQRVLVGHHLRGCTRCAVEVGQIRGLGVLLRATPPPVAQAPDGLVDRLLAIGAPRPTDTTPAPTTPAPGPSAADPVAADPVAVDPLVVDPVAADPVAVDPVVKSPVPAGPVLFVPVRRVPRVEDAHVRPSVGAAGVLVAAVVMVGTVGAGAVVTGVPVPWPSASTRASVATVLTPRLFSGGGEPGGAVSVRPVDNGARP